MPQPTRLRPRFCTLSWFRIRASAGTSLAATVLALLWCGAACAQGGVPLITVATDQSPLNLSNQFGIPAATAINQAGDFAFVGNGESALFLRLAGASSATRVLQIYDEAPGFPGSQIDSIFPRISLNSSHVLLFEAGFTGADHLLHSALLTYDGANYHTLVTSDQSAPGSNGATYGLEFIPAGIDDSGDSAFENVTVSAGTSTTIPSVASTVYILPAGAAAALRIVGSGDTPPANCTWCIVSTTSAGSLFPGTPGLNARGQVLLSLWGGLFIGSKDGALTMVPMAGSGACSPSATKSGVLLPGGPTAFLNNVGAVAFSNPPNSASAAICVVAAGATLPVAAISAGDPAPAGIGGGTILSPIALGFDDAGDIVYGSPISGSTVTTYAVLRYHSSSPQPDVVAYDCEPAPGATGSVFSEPSLSWSSTSPCGGGSVFVASQQFVFTGVSIANGGLVSFSAQLSNGGSAVYRQTGAASPEFVSLATDAPGMLAGIVSSSSGPLFLSTGQTEILSSGSVFFDSYPASGPVDFAEYLGTPGNVQTLMSATDMLPPGAVTLLGLAPPKAAGHFVAFAAQPAAGRVNLLEADLTSGAITRVLSDNDPAVAAAGGSPGDRVLTSNFFLNQSGQIALETSTRNVSIGVGASSLGTPVNAAWLNLTTAPCGAIYLWSPGGGLAKVAAPGDPTPGSNQPFACLTLNDSFPTPLNGTGQVAFTTGPTVDGITLCLLQCIAAGGSPDGGVFLYTPGGSISEIAAAGDTLPGQTQATSFVPPLSVPANSSGMVAFGAQIGASTTTGQGFFLRQAGGAAQSVMMYGDAVPGSGDTFAFPHFIAGLTDGGNLAFTASTGSAADGLFLAPSGAPIETLALDGGAAPGGGTFSLLQPFPINSVPPVVGNFAQMNGESDVAFGSTLVGGASNSGLFRAMHSGSGIGALQALAVQGQAAPGGGSFGTIHVETESSADFALGPDGALAFANLVTSGAGVRQGMFVARPDGTLIKVAETGDSLPGGGLVADLSLSPRLAAGDAGKFAFLASIEGGAARRSIFVTSIAPGTAATIAALIPLQSPAIAQQPVALAATVTSTAPGTPSGSVTFFSNGISLGSGSLDKSGQASVTTSALAAGPDSIVAQYSGDSNFASDNSAPMPIVAAGFAPAPASLSVTAGQSLVIPLTVYAPAGLNLNFTLSCSGLPVNSSCAFDTNPVSPSATGTVVKLKFTTMAASKGPFGPPQSGAPVSREIGFGAVLAALYAAALAWRRAPRLRLASCACVVVSALALGLSGCGAITSSGNSAPSSSGTPPGLGSFYANGTSGSTTISTVVKVTVQ